MHGMLILGLLSIRGVLVLVFVYCLWPMAMKGCLC